jgi:aldehyde dehydrogenase (NAD+)
MKGSQMPKQWTFESFIGGKWTSGNAAAALEIINPATEQVIGSVPQATRDDAQAAILAARKAFDDGPWPWLTVPERAKAIKRFAEALDNRRAEIAELLTAEVGMVSSLEPIQVGEGLLAAHYCADWVEHALEWESVTAPAVGAASMGGRMIVREPIGVVGAITPFNFPFMLDMWKVAPALAVGCTVVLKPHPLTPLQSCLIAQAAEEAGIPEGVLNVVAGGAEIGEELTTSPLVDCIAFTGSTATGKQILKVAADTVKKVQLELGGKSVQLVLPDVPNEIVGTLGCQGVIVHAGQGCGLPTRLLLHESQLEAFIAGAEATTPLITVGDPADPSIAMGPLISAAQRERVEGYVASGLEQGARLIAGGKRPTHLDRGFFYEPTIFVDATNDMRIAQEEIFGPVLTVITYQTEEQAIALANESMYGLAGFVLGMTSARAFNVARQIRSGNMQAIGVGAMLTPPPEGATNPGLGRGPGWGGGGPVGMAGSVWGGYKQSGQGREWGKYGFEEFTELKSISWT